MAQASRASKNLIYGIGKGIKNTAIKKTVQNIYNLGKSIAESIQKDTKAKQERVNKYGKVILGG